MMSCVVIDQVSSWKDNPVISSKTWIDLSEVDFPAVTLCHQGNTRLTGAERINNAMRDKSPKIRQFRNLLLRTCVDLYIGYKLPKSDDHSYVYESRSSVVSKKVGIFLLTVIF